MALDSNISDLAAPKVQLNRNDYPNITYWTSKEWESNVQGLKAACVWDKDNSSDPSQPCAALGYICGEDRTPVANFLAIEIRQTCRFIWKQLAENTAHPLTWSKVSLSTICFYREHMY
jgi:hypothetical protein